jgi:hypothetical protein
MGTEMAERMVKDVVGEIIALMRVEGEEAGVVRGGSENGDISPFDRFSVFVIFFLCFHHFSILFFLYC